VNNCLIFAVAQWWRRGGFVLMRKSPRGWWPHFLWSRDLKTFEEYIALRPRYGMPLPPPLYHGHVRTTTVSDQVAICR
jgi:hypothetical protein